jgi:hypothetical protein
MLLFMHYQQMVTWYQLENILDHWKNNIFFLHILDSERNVLFNASENLSNDGNDNYLSTTDSIVLFVLIRNTQLVRLIFFVNLLFYSEEEKKRVKNISKETIFYLNTSILCFYIHFLILLKKGFFHFTER